MHSRSDAPGLHWRIKRQFLQYIARMPDGECSITDGACADEAELFHYSFDHMVGSPGTPTWSAACRGEVRFAGHHGFLFVRLADPIVRIEDGAGYLSILTRGDTERAYQKSGANVADLTAAESSERIDVASFEWSQGPDKHVLAGRCVRLAAEAVDLFNGVYPAGERLDDFHLVLPTTIKETP